MKLPNAIAAKQIQIASVGSGGSGRVVAIMEGRGGAAIGAA
jgi:hypothetical protein